MEAAKTASKEDTQRAGVQRNRCSGEGQDTAELHRPPAEGEHRSAPRDRRGKAPHTASVAAPQHGLVGLGICCHLPDPPQLCWDPRIPSTAVPTERAGQQCPRPTSRCSSWGHSADGDKGKSTENLTPAHPAALLLLHNLPRVPLMVWLFLNLSSGIIQSE